jgi:hypothetical protein
MTIGGVNTDLHLEEIKYTPLLPYFNTHVVELIGIRVGEKTIGLGSESSYPKIVSGDTYSYFPSTEYHGIIDAIYEYCRSSSNH